MVRSSHLLLFTYALCRVSILYRIDIPFKILQKLEREFYQNQKEFTRLAQLKKELEDLPKQRQCHRYRWTQTETTFDMEIPMQKVCDEKDLYLVVEKDQMQVAIKTDEAFGAITVSGNMVFACLFAKIVLL